MRKYCRIRKDLSKGDFKIDIQGEAVDVKDLPTKLEYRWLGDTEGFQVHVKGKWQDAESIDFEFPNDSTWNDYIL